MRSRTLLASTVAAAVAACSPPEGGDVIACRAAVKTLLRSPSTYVEHEVNDLLGNKVWLTFDAANAYGTPVRALASCVFDGKKLVGLSYRGRDIGEADLAIAQLAAEKALED